MAETTTLKPEPGTGQLHAPIGRVQLVTQIPTTVAGYYGSSITLTDDEWRGGEIVYHTGVNQLYIQTATSGKTATWKRYLTAFTAA